MKLLLLSALFGLVLTLEAQAMPLYIDVYGMIGYTGTSVTSGSSPTLFQAGGGGTLAYNFGTFFVGASSDYRLINQYSDVDPLVGNRRGTRFNLVSPTLGIKLGDFIVKADYQFLGDYKLGNKTADGFDASFTSPSGFRGSINWGYSSMAYFGAYYETVQFSKFKISNGTSTDLSTKLTLWQVGATITLKISSLFESEYDFDF